MYHGRKSKVSRKLTTTLALILAANLLAAPVTAAAKEPAGGEVNTQSSGENISGEGTNVLPRGKEGTETPTGEGAKTPGSEGTEVPGGEETETPGGESAGTPGTETPEVPEENFQPPYVTYAGHVQNYGDMAAVSDGVFLGTQGQSLRMEAFYISKGAGLSGVEGDIRYRVHAQDYGTMSWVQNGTKAGTSGESKRVEAIQVVLTGRLAELFDVYYTTHVQNYGWMKWTKGSADRSGWCGSMGQSLRVEAICIRLVKKGEAPPTNGSSLSLASYAACGDVLYTAHQQNYGDLQLAANNAVLGHPGEHLRLEALRVALNDTQWEGSVEYNTHVQNIGWTDWSANGELSGTRGQSLRVEAVQMRLTGELANHCEIWYRVFVHNMGWLGWARNGQKAGTESMSYPIEAIEITLVPHGCFAPGANVNSFCTKQFVNPCPGGRLTYGYGYREDGFHKGMDLCAPQGTPTYAADSGVVVSAGWNGSAGIWVLIDHGNGFRTKYLHHSGVCVSAGQYVQRGQQIGWVGSTGASEAMHLHFQVELNGQAVNPQEYM